MGIDLKNLLKNIDRRYGFTYRRLKRRTRRATIACLLGAFVIFYLLYKLFPHSTAHKTVQYDECLRDRLEQFSFEQTEMNTIFNHEPIHYGEIISLPYTGNGYLGLSLSSPSQVQFLTDIRSSFIFSGYSPIIQISSDTWQISSASILQLKQGLVRCIQCLKLNSERSAYVSYLLYAHRKRSSLIIQEIEMTNPTEYTLDIDLKQKQTNFENDFKELHQENLQFDSSKDQFQLTINQISTRQHHFLIFVVITNKILSNIHIKPGSQEKQTIYTIIRFSPSFSENSLLNQSYIHEWQNKLQKQAKDEMSEVLSLSSTKLLKEHTDTWSSIWQSGFSISRSLAPSAINGDVINRTIYYVLCSTPALMYDLNYLDDDKRNEFNQSLFQIDQCYESHSTLIGEKLWTTPGDDLAVLQLANLWRSTLSRKGCFTLMRSGVNGVLQSMILSIGGIRFRNHHLEMYLDPKELHRDMKFRSINFGKQYHVTINITVERDNRAVIDVSIDNDNGQAYACDAACLDPPKKLSSQSVRFPVKMTSPPTAILYIAEDLEYMSQLKDTLHVKEVEIAPPHAHGVLALHRHGHRYGGLPIIFWIALVFLIIIFHLFLLKIILNEMGFFKQTLPTYKRTRVL